MSNKYLLEGGEVVSAVEHTKPASRPANRHDVLATKENDRNLKRERYRHMMFNKESIVEKILEEAALTDKIKEIAHHLSNHLGRHVTVGEVKKYYVQSLRKKHEENMKGMYDQ